MVWVAAMIGSFLAEVVRVPLEDSLLLMQMLAFLCIASTSTDPA